MVHALTLPLAPAVRRQCAAPARPDRASWRALHLFADGDADPILCHGLMPLLRDALDSDRISCFFFVRYWVDGAHLRVRFAGPNHHTDALARRLTRAAHADTTGAPPAPKPDRVRVDDARYEPETDRYAGPDCLPLCEAHFMLSSVRVWSRLAGQIHLPEPHRTQRVRLPWAALDLAEFVGSAIPRPDEASRFLAWYWKTWLLPRGLARASAAGRQLRSSLEERLAQQYEAIGEGPKRAVWERWSAGARGVPDGSQAGDAATVGSEEWAEGNRVVLSALEDRGLDLTEPRGLRALAGLVHMHNNRYGVGNRDEAWLAYLCQRVVSGGGR